MTGYLRNAAHFALLALTCAVGCGAPESDEELIATEGADTGEEVAQKESDFIVVDGMYKNLMSRAHSSIRVCLTGDGMTNQNRTERQRLIRESIMAWIDAARPASTGTLISGSEVSYGCIDQHVTVNWSAKKVEAGCFQDFSCRAHVDPNNGYQMNLFEGNGDGTVLHEFGHEFGLGDAYVNGAVMEPLPGQSLFQHMAQITAGELWHEDKQAIQEAYCINFPDKCARRWSRDADWCNSDNQELFVGDFNRDGRDDLLCHDRFNGKKWIDYANAAGQFNGTNWSKAMSFCDGADRKLYIGDFNGDSRDDLLCHAPVAGSKWIAYANEAGEFTGTDWSKNMNWCSHSTGELYIGDFNGDERDDMLCHDWSNGSKWVTLADADGHFTGATWWSNFNWCGHADGQLHLGDFNEDGRDDLLCHDVKTGRKWISLASSSGRFGANLWEADLKWCRHAGGEVHVGYFGDDFPGDSAEKSTADLLCHDVGTGKKWIAFGMGGDDLLEGTSRYWDPGWCTGSSSKLYIGDFDGNNVDDFLCHDSVSGSEATMMQY